MYYLLLVYSICCMSNVEILDCFDLTQTCDLCINAVKFSGCLKNRHHRLPYRCLHDLQQQPSADEGLLFCILLQIQL